jgi:hypothetical protein
MNMFRQAQHDKVFRGALILLVSLFTAFDGTSQSGTFSKAYKPGSKLYVHALQGLSLRANSDLKAKVIEVIPFGAEVEVIPDTKPKVPITNSNISGTWVKVKRGANSGYLFDGFLSRLKSMDLPKHARYPNELIDYLKSIYKVKIDTDKSPNVAYIEYRSIEFTNGVEYESKSYEGGVVFIVNFPTAMITFQEVYLLARLAYLEIFKENGCPYQPENMVCEIDEGLSSLELKILGDHYSMFFGIAD